jgi:hypothetical protein
VLVAVEVAVGTGVSVGGIGVAEGSGVELGVAVGGLSVAVGGMGVASGGSVAVGLQPASSTARIKEIVIVTSRFFMRAPFLETQDTHSG